MDDSRNNEELGERLYKMVVQDFAKNMPGAMIIFDVVGQVLRIRYVSESIIRITGFTAEETYERNSEDTVADAHPEDKKLLLDKIKGAVKQKTRLEHTYRVICKDGIYKWVELSISPAPEEQVYYGVFRDVNEKHENEIMRDNLVNALPGGIAIYRMGDPVETLYFSEGVPKITGHTSEEYAALVEGDIIERIVFSGDRPQMRMALYENISMGRPLNMTYRILHKDGSLVWIQISGTKIREDNGIPVYYTIFTKPTDEAALYSNIVEDSAIGVIVAEKENRRILYNNSAARRVHHLPNDTEINGKRLQDLLEKQGKVPLMTQEQVAELEYDSFSNFQVERNGSYYGIKAKALMWNGVASYIMYISDETIEHERQLQHQQEMEKKQKMEQALMASIPGGVAIYRLKKDGSVVTEYVSEGLAKMSGYTQEEFLSLLRENAMVNVPENEIPLVMEAARNSLAEHKPVSIIYHIHRKDKPDLLNRLDANIIEDSELGEDDVAVWYAVHTYVSENSKLALREQVHYRSVLNMLGIAYWEWSEQNGFYASENYMKYALSKVPMEDVRNRKAVNIVHPDDEFRLQEYFSANSSSREATSITLRMLMTDGSYQWTELISFEEHSADGRMVRLSGTMRNVNDEWIEQRKILEDALETAKKANAAKTTFLSRVSHDMRTPLNGILGLAGLMKESITDSKTLHDLAQMEASGQYLLNLINDTLDVSRIETGNLELHPSVCDGRAIFDSVMALAKPTIDAKQIHLDVKASGLQYPMLYIDMGRVEQIVLNIIGNAAKFTPEGGSIVCSVTNLSTEDGKIIDQVCIRDSGIGISKEFLPHIFEPFSQEDGSKKNSNQGTGLGMIITKQLVELMGGTISVESEVGEGTCVTFTLVMPMATEQQITEWREAQQIVLRDTSLLGKRILLCEDHPLNAQIAIRLLEKKGVEIDHAQNGEIGFELFKNSPEGYYDAILMDVRMPVMDGLETAAAMRKLQRTDAAVIPIIAMTANALDDDVEQTREAGMNAHLSKPIHPDILYQVLDDFLIEDVEK